MRYLFVVALMLFPALGWAQPADRKITVNAESFVAAIPDMAVISLGVESAARTADAALEGNSQDMDAVLSMLKASGLEDRDIQTSGFSIDPIYAQDMTNRQITGYVVRNQVQARVRDLDGLGALLDQVVASGANRLQGLRFDVQNTEPLADQALSGAVARATAKAGLMADAAGVRLGPVLSMSESGGFSAPMASVRGMAMESMAVPVASGEVTVSAMVTMVFGIVD